MNDYALRSHRCASRLVGALFVTVLLAGTVLLPLSAQAQTLPSGWTASNVGSPALSGTATHSSGTFTVEGAGVDIWDPADQFMFVRRQVTGDVTLTARVGSIENTHDWAKAGVMIRESLSSTSKHAFALVSRARGVALQHRRTTGGASGGVGGTGAAPMWVRIERRGSTFTASKSSDGTSWTQIGSTTISMTSTVYIGLAVTSHNASTRATATFSNVTFGTPAATTLPSGWTAADIGAPSVRGGTTYDGSGFTVSGAGVDIWGTSDQFHYAYRQVSGDVDVIARVASLQGNHDWSKAGLMIRPSLGASAANAMVLVSRSRGLALQHRPGTGLSTTSASGGSGTAPVWLKLERRGSSITAFRSSTGTSWTMIGSRTLTLGSSFYVGLAVTNHYASSAARALFTNVAVTSASGGGTTNQPPTVSLTAPAAGATYSAPASVVISANAADTDGSVARVDFYSGTTLVGSDTSSPYSVTWSNVQSGSYSLTAVARDNAGATTTSAARSITVGTATPTPLTTAVFSASPDHNTSLVTSYRLEIFTAGANPSTATPMAVQNLGKPAVSNGECRADIAATISGLPGGNYFATVRAVGPGGMSARAVSATFTR